MSVKSNGFSYVVSAIAGSVLFLGTATALAQVGSIDYEPYIEVPVPVGGGIFMLVLGALLGGFALWKISHSGFSGNKAIAVLLSMGSVAFSMSGGQMLHEAYATVNNDLSNPLGGTVAIFPGYQEYQNTSGEVLKITAVNVDDCEAVHGGSDAQGLLEPTYPECSTESGPLLQGGICTTNFPPCADSARVTTQAGYYWVRADYPALRDDHASVCGEFGLVATSYSVTLTWDATLLATLSADFGYQSNGDDNDAATAMWCWDGDGGPVTPTGHCETHNFGPQFENYGRYSGDPDERPVFTCTAPQVN